MIAVTAPALIGTACAVATSSSTSTALVGAARAIAASPFAAAGLTGAPSATGLLGAARALAFFPLINTEFVFGCLYHVGVGLLKGARFGAALVGLGKTLGSLLSGALILALLGLLHLLELLSESLG